MKNRDFRSKHPTQTPLKHYFSGASRPNYAHKKTLNSGIPSQSYFRNRLITNDRTSSEMTRLENFDQNNSISTGTSFRQITSLELYKECTYFELFLNLFCSVSAVRMKTHRREKNNVFGAASHQVVWIHMSFFGGGSPSYHLNNYSYTRFHI